MLAPRRGALLSFSTSYHCFIVHIIVKGWWMNDFSVLSSCGPFQSAEVPPFSVWAILVLSCPPNIFLRGARQRWQYKSENWRFESLGTAISVDCHGPPAHRKSRFQKFAILSRHSKTKKTFWDDQDLNPRPWAWPEQMSGTLDRLTTTDGEFGECQPWMMTVKV